MTPYANESHILLLLSVSSLKFTMNTKSLLSITAAGAFFFSAQINAGVSFVNLGDAIATAEWDTWTAPGYPGFGPFPFTVDSGESIDQGSGSTTSNGASFTSSSVITSIIDNYTSPPGGTLNGGDSYYIHNGAYEWDVSGELDSSATHFRISYGMVNAPESQGGGTSDFGLTPNTSISGATVTDTGSYARATGDVYYTTFTIAGGSSTFSVNFGDVAMWNSTFAPDAGSYNSVDAIYLEAFNGTPSAVPEPQSFALLSGLIASICLATRRRVRS